MKDFDQKLYAKMSPFELKDELIHRAEESLKKHCVTKVLNAGRGNPDFLHIPVRKMFCLLSEFALEAAKTSTFLGKRPGKKNIAQELDRFLQARKQDPYAKLLKDLLAKTVKKFSFSADEFIFELVDASLGDFYPEPPRMFSHIEQMVEAYLKKILHVSSSKKFSVFATEGASAAMFYLFNSLKANKLLKLGDKVAILTPIFSPYLEMPQLPDYKLRTILIQSQKDQYGRWEVPSQELEKLKDPKVKAFYLVNPNNPTSVPLQEKTLVQLQKLVQSKRKDLIIICDAVYATFSSPFQSLLEKLSKNTIGVYSFSKYFGMTGWRLGTIFMQKGHIVDELIQKLPRIEREALKKRYQTVGLSPEKIPFIDRLLLDSRQPSLAHTGGLSGPQQCMMGMCSLFSLQKEDRAYLEKIQNLLKERMDSFFTALGVSFPVGKDHTRYYALLDLLEIGEAYYGKKFKNYLEKNHSCYEFLFRLAEEKGIICLPGIGFGAAPWSIRVSLANLEKSDYQQIGRAIRDLFRKFHLQFSKK